MEVKQKRKPRAYKIFDAPYYKAMEVLSKEGKFLANLIEDYVIHISNGGDYRLKTGVKPIVSIKKK